MKLQIIINIINLIAWIAVFVINLKGYLGSKEDIKRWEDFKKEYEKFKQKYNQK